MNNELQLSQDLNIITAEINSYKQVAGQAIFEIGRRLKWIKENDLAHGQWVKWLETIEMNQDHARRYVKVYEEFGNSNHVTSRVLGLSALYEISQIPENEREKPHTIASTGETKKIDDMTVKELREVKRTLKEVEEEKKRLQNELHKEKNKPVKVETKVIEREIDNTDYNSITKLNNQIQQRNKEYELLMNEKKALENKMRLTEKENEDFQNLKKQIQFLTKEKEDISRQIEAATSISGLVIEIDHLIKEKLAPVKYSKAIQEMSHDEIVMNNLSDILHSVQSWCDEMRKFLHNDRKIIDVEVL